MISINAIVNKCINYYTLKKKKVTYGKGLRIFGRLKVRVDHYSNVEQDCSQIKIGKNVTINSGIKYNPIGGDAVSILRVINEGNIIIGNNVGLSNTCIVSAGEVCIGNNVLLGGGVKIYDNDFHSLNFNKRMFGQPMDEVIIKNVKIDDGAFIGACSIVLKGVEIGEYSIVGAGSVVTKSIPPREIWAGNPAKFIRRIDNDI